MKKKQKQKNNSLTSVKLTWQQETKQNKTVQHKVEQKYYDIKQQQTNKKLDLGLGHEACQSVVIFTVYEAISVHHKGCNLPKRFFLPLRV